MKKVTIVSGKGGVGKTTLTACLAMLFHRDQYNLVLTDCDVDAPNLALTLKNQELERSEVYSANIAIVDKELCTGCQECLNHCKFDAIKWDRDENKPIINEFECEGCGVCTLVCPAECVKLIPVKTGNLIKSKSKYGFPIISGELEIGRGNSGKIVAEAKMMALKNAEQEAGDVILNDGPPGIGCPVIASLSDSDFILIITEPFPAAIHDLKRVLTLAWNFTADVGMVINKYDLNLPLVQEVETFALQNNVKLLGKIPLDNKIPESLLHISPIIEYAPDSPASQAISIIYDNLKFQLGLKKN